MTFLSFDKAELQNLSTFDSIKEMNDCLNKYRQKFSLLETDKRILEVISKYACKYVGVCFLSKRKIANEAGFKSRRTAIRSCHRLEEAGIIKQYETRRNKGDHSRGANIIVIQPHQIKHTNKSRATVTSGSHRKETTNKTINELDNNTYETVDFVKRGLKNSIPHPIYQALSPFFDGKTMFEVYGILLRAKRKINPTILIEDYEEEYVDAFYNVIRLYKMRKVKNLLGYLYCVWERLTAEIDRRLAWDNILYGQRDGLYR